ncbi:S1 family peptidase [Streptomyces sp. BG9H]|uniref:S1 family peptidase n=2 Tax=Streptomyces anatolicus TaxID=2675858 RepID=A0ABS6YG77_9ACTN|nr:S1 family peptidase [Streptomyces anatolicus]
MVSALADSLGISEWAAVRRLDRQAEQQRILSGLGEDAARDGAFFDAAGTLTLNVADRETAQEVEEAGLRARIPQHGQTALDRIKAQLDTKAARQTPTGVYAWSVDLASDTVTIKVHSDTGATARAFLKAARSHGDAVRIVKGKQPLEPQAVVAPGSKMTIGSGYCSVGFGARNSSGKQYLVSASHCVEGLPDLYYNNAHFAKGAHTRFTTGQSSVDMGVAAVDSDDSIATAVTTYGQAGTIAVKGSTRAAAGAAMCKSGATTGWTCGKVKSYNNTVNYGGTMVSGLGSSSVCSERGDSGGAYISGNQAQGMTSGGPVGQQCSGVNGTGSSYFQPLDDALNHYGLALNTN